jgi:hypothetical protein
VKIELLWFQDCPSHEAAETMLRDAMSEAGVDQPIIRVEVPNEATGIAVCFPGSPTIRIDGLDVEPGWQPCDDCTPRCRVYQTSEGLSPLPERAWILDRLRLPQ